MDIKKILGKNIQNYRKLQNITQEQLAETVGIDTISLSKIETGRNYPTAENLAKIAKILNVEVYELFVISNLKTNDELISEIDTNLQKISNDNKKLNILNAALKSLV